jgi:ubiquitin carboxyl-terminal hydrolase 7
MVVPRAPELPQQDQDEEMLVPHQDVVEGPQQDVVEGPQQHVVEGPQPMEESASTVENQLMPDPSTSRFTWSIENFSKRNVRKHYSDDFVVGGYKWRVLVFPRGNNTDYLSMYLDVADSHLLPPGWSRYAQFSLAVVNQLDSKMSMRKGISCYLSLAHPDCTSLKCTVLSLVLLAILLSCFLFFFCLSASVIHQICNSA